MDVLMDDIYDDGFDSILKTLDIENIVPTATQVDHTVGKPVSGKNTHFTVPRNVECSQSLDMKNQNPPFPMISHCGNVTINYNFGILPHKN